MAWPDFSNNIEILLQQVYSNATNIEYYNIILQMQKYLFILIME